MESTTHRQLSEIGDQDLKQFSELVEDRYGLHLDWYNPLSVKRRLQRVITSSGLKNLHELSLVLGRNRDFFEKFIELFTVKVTELFREPNALKELKTSAFPFLRRIIEPKILIVGCSTGEEIISLCIHLHEAGLLANSRIMATDISAQAIEKAKNFAVSKTKIQHAAMNYKKSGGIADLSDYYQSTSSMCFFNPKLFEKVEWSLFDLTQSELAAQYDLILCRNVLIYFNHLHQSKPLARLERHLCPGGFLMLGEQESIAFYRNSNYQIQTVSTQYKLYRKSLKVL